MLLLACPATFAAEAEKKEKEEKLGTVVGIDLGTTCVA
jgi:hypothetical protein